MTTRTQRAGAGGFILSEAPGHLSRDNATLASGETYQAGTVLMDNGSGKLVIHDGTTTAAKGVLYAYADASAGDLPVVIVRHAEVIFELLVGLDEFSDEEKGNVYTALAAIGIRERPTQPVPGGSGGGDELPDPIAVADFVNHAYTVGVTSYAVTEFFGEDAEPGSTFDEADVVAGGLRGIGNGGTSQPSIIGPLLSAWLGTEGCTLVVDFDSTADEDMGMVTFDAFNSGDWDTDIAVGVSRDADNFLADFQYVAQDTDPDAGSFSSGHSKAAITHSKARLSASVNGGAVVTLVAAPQIDDWAVLTKIYFLQDSFRADYIRSIKLYAPQDDAVLPMLSAVSGGGGDEEEDDMTKAIVPLTATQINHLFTVPQTILAAPGAGKAICVHNVINNIAYGTANLTDGGHAPKIRFGNSSGPVLVPIDFDQNTNWVKDGRTDGMNTFIGGDPALVENQPLVLVDTVDGAGFGHVATITIASGGSGYSVNDTFAVEDTNGSGSGFGAEYVVDTVDGGGAVLTCHQTERGSSYSVSNDNDTSTGDGGTGLTINITAITPGDGAAQLIIFYDVITLL